MATDEKQQPLTKRQLHTLFEDMVNADNKSVANAYQKVNLKTSLTLHDKKYLVKQFTKLGLRKDAEKVFKLTLSKYSSKSRPKYSYSLNKQLPSRKSRNDISDLIRPCNIDAFNKTEFLDIPLEIELANGKCVSAESDEAKDYLINRLRHSKHLNLQKLITPKQYDSNCYFNAMIVSFFISDKGREFFNFFRFLMIIGELANGDEIPEELRNLFILFNFFIECFISGRPEAIDNLDTNVLIKAIHKKIGNSQNLVNVDEAGNTVSYLIEMLEYLCINSINIEQFNADMTDVEVELHNTNPLHIIILVTEGNSSFKAKQVLRIKKTVYHLDSASLISFQGSAHYCACVTCNGEDYVFDGNSHTRLHKMQWKSLINKDHSFSFEPETEIQWNFKYSEVAFVYYRVV